MSNDGNIIKLINVTKYFGNGRGRKVVIENFSMTICSNSVTAILGASGAGKSTLINLIAGIYEPDSGTVFLGHCTPKKHQKEGNIGYVFQGGGLLPWLTVRKNIELPFLLTGKYTLKGNIFELLRLIGLNGKQDSYPKTLSGGMKQRVALARALSTNPSFILLDEPFSNLDEPLREELVQRLLDIWHNIYPTVLFISHSIKDAIMMADKIFVVSGNPSCHIISSFEVDLPKPRNRNVRREFKYLELYETINQSLAESEAC